jgi:hypothetical protein
MEQRLRLVLIIRAILNQFWLVTGLVSPAGDRKFIRIILFKYDTFVAWD